MLRSQGLAGPGVPRLLRGPQLQPPAALGGVAKSAEEDKGQASFPWLGGQGRTGHIPSRPGPGDSNHHNEQVLAACARRHLTWPAWVSARRPWGQPRPRQAAWRQGGVSQLGTQVGWLQSITGNLLPRPQPCTGASPADELSGPQALPFSPPSLRTLCPSLRLGFLSCPGRFLREPPRHLF